MAIVRRGRFAAVLLACVMLLAVFAVPVKAASENVEGVVARLEQLQNANIDPAWQPDIAANEAHVQALLDDYLALTAEERAELTPQQNEDLRAYFEALYAVQDKDLATVDEIFAGGAAASSELPAVPESLAGDESGVSSEASSAPSESQSLPGNVVDVSGSGASSASMPSPTQQPQVPAQGGFLGGGALGTILLVLLVVLCIVLFVRFMAMMRKNGKPRKKEEDPDHARARELFGENYMDVLEGEEEKKDKPAAKPAATTARPAAAAAKPAAKPAAGAAPSSVGSTPFAPIAPPAPKPEAKPEEAAPPPAAESLAAPQQEKPASGLFGAGGWFGRKKNETPQPEPETPAATEEEKEEAAPVENRENSAPRNDGENREALSPLAAAMPPQPPKPQQDEPEQEQDEGPAIFMRSFSGGAGPRPRTGKPNKTSFRQGSPDDLDAIDE